MVRVGINGFGRIGRLAFRIGTTRLEKEIEFAAINTSGSMKASGWAHLVKYDTMYGKFEKPVMVSSERDPKEATDDNPHIGDFGINGKTIPIFAQRDPERIPWGANKVDVVIESTGKFTTEDGAKKHAKAGAKRVVISAPSKGGNVGTYVLGVNEYEGEGVVISNASCTTNCVAPVASVMNNKFGIKKALMTTIHGYTDDQRLQDNSHKDMRRARAAAANIVPTTTGAAKATTETIPALKGIFDGRAIRVPILTGSLTDFTFLVKTPTDVGAINNAFVEASQNVLYKGILSTTDEPLVSSDIVGRSESSIIDLAMTQVVGGDLVKVFAWYDNEWGYANRLMEQVVRVGRTLDGNQVPTDAITLTNSG